MSYLIGTLNLYSKVEGSNPATSTLFEREIVGQKWTLRDFTTSIFGDDVMY